MTATIELECYVISLGEKLGQGSFGSVYKARHLHTETPVAAKQIMTDTDRDRKCAQEEISALRQLQLNPNVVKILNHFPVGNTLWIVMEFCEAGDLNKYYYDHNPELDMHIAIMLQCASGVAFMHHQTDPIIHRDIKPANILLKRSGRNVVVKLSDFGLAKTVETRNAAGSAEFNTRCGSEAFMAPELFDPASGPYTRRVDVFALGVCYLSMIRHSEGEEKLRPKIEGIRRPIGLEMAERHERGEPMPDVIKEENTDSRRVKLVKQLIKRMTAYNQGERARIREVKSVLDEIKNLSAERRGRGSRDQQRTGNRNATGHSDADRHSLVFQRFVRDMLMGKDINRQPVGRPATLLSPVGVELLKIGDDINRRYEPYFAMIDALNLEPETAHETFMGVARKMFSDGEYNWGRVVTLTFVGYRMASWTLYKQLSWYAEVTNFG